MKITSFVEYNKRAAETQMESCKNEDYLRLGLISEIGELAAIFKRAIRGDFKLEDKRIPALLKIPARVRFLSCEPLVGPVNLTSVIGDDGWGRDALRVHDHTPGMPPEHHPDWVICGGESGPKARPMHPDWARSLRDQCKAAGVAYFFKQWGEWLPCLGVLQEEPYKNHYEQASDGKMLMVKGNRPEPARRVLDEKVVAFRVGKARAGHLLDGLEHREFPALMEVPHD